jgi:hypothetical protein
MARASPRISFNSSTFTCLLSELAVAEVDASRQPFAERLGLWLDWTAAIPLSAALHAGAPAPGWVLSSASAVLSASAAGKVAAEAMARVQAEITQAIATDALLTAGTPRSAPGTRAATSAASVTPDDSHDFSPYRRCYQAHQQGMQVRITALRAQVRQALAGQSAALGKLAALDGVLDQALAVRERSLLATVPSLLQARFAQLRRAHLAAQARPPGSESPGPDPGPGPATAPAPDPAPEPPTQPQAWLALARREMQNMLMAEMELRLQPVEGLLEALCTEAAAPT